MNKTEFYRNCPECNDILYYKTLKIKKTADRLNRICKKCSNTGYRNPNYGKPCPESVRDIISEKLKGRIVSKETKEKRSKSLSGKNNPMFGKKGEICPNFGAKRTEEHKLKLKELKTGIPLKKEHRDNISKSQMGRKHKDETIKKMRISKVEYILKKNGGVRPSYNLKACELFSILEERNNWDGFFATKNKEYHLTELGYFLDYYEPNLNIVIEYDEPKHYYIDNKLKEKDINRMNEIKEYLKCDFFRYNERTKELLKY